MSLYIHNVPPEALYVVVPPNSVKGKAAHSDADHDKSAYYTEKLISACLSEFIVLHFTLFERIYFPVFQIIPWYTKINV